MNDAIRVSIRFWENFYSSESIISKSQTINESTGIAAMRRWNVSLITQILIGLKSGEHDAYVVLRPLQACSLQVKLYEVWHYHVLKESNRQWLQCKVRHDV